VFVCLWVGGGLGVVYERSGCVKMGRVLIGVCGCCIMFLECVLFFLGVCVLCVLVE